MGFLEALQALTNLAVHLRDKMRYLWTGRAHLVRNTVGLSSVTNGIQQNIDQHTMFDGGQLPH